MAMTSSGMSAVMFAALNAEFGVATGDLIAYRQRTCDALSSAIVTYIKANATVATSVTVASVSGVTTGVGVSGPGAGTGAGTIS